MRVYEFSKQCGVPARELLDMLSEGGFEIHSHMAVLPQDGIDFLTKKLDKSAKSEAKETKKKPAKVEAQAKISVKSKGGAKEEAKKVKGVIGQEHKVVQAAPAKSTVASVPPVNIQPAPAKPEVKSVPYVPTQQPSAQKSQQNSTSSQAQPQTHHASAPAQAYRPVNQTQQGSQHMRPQGHQARPTHGIPFKDERTAPETPKFKESEGLIHAPTAVAQVAEQLYRPVNDVILALLKLGILSSKNQLLNEKIIAQLAEHYKVKLLKPHVATAEKEPMSAVKPAEGKALQERLPIVVVMGHVDHGKTTLLDFIRKTRVAQKEKGGITQHLGAYEASTSQGNIVFLDTPGHEAFSRIRMRGSKVADIAILVVAADDGIMPQTIEAISHARAANLPIIVAINKVDKVEPTRLEGIRRELAQHDLLPEDWGGQTIAVPISAKTGKGIDQLLDMIVLQAQMMELKADGKSTARGYILESKLEKGRGAVATFIAQQGALHVGDTFVCGSTFGRVSSLVNSLGERIKEVGPSVPVQVAGFSDLPEAGDLFEVVSAQEQQERMRKLREAPKSSFTTKATSSENAINIIVKTDSHSSKEALLGSIAKVSKSVEKGFNILLSGVGDISESDVILAENTGSVIVGLHVKAEPNAALLAQRLGVNLNLQDIIYKLLESLEEMARGKQEVKMISTKIGEAVVRKVFDIKDLGVIAGSYVRDGRFNRDGKVTIYRGNKKIGEGKIKSLQRDKKTVKEVHTGFECGFIIENFGDFQVDDRVECYLEVPETQAAPKPKK
jgi:translation initiation factor IF-2